MAPPARSRSKKSSSAELRNALLYALDPPRWAEDRCGWKPDPWQRDIMRNNQRNILLNCCRQSGKTTTAAQIAAHFAYFVPGSLSVILGPAQRQAAGMLRQARRLHAKGSGGERLLRNNVFDLETAQESRIITLPNDEDNVRGAAGVNLLLLDEASRIPDDLYYAVIPFITVSRGRQIAMSTPKGKRGWFWTAWNGEDGEEWAKVEVPWMKCPRLDQEQIEGLRIKFGPSRFAQEYECTFNAMEGMLFDPDDLAAARSDEVNTWDLEGDDEEGY